MGVDVSAVTMVGVRFESHDNGEEFIRAHFEDVPEEIDSDDYEDITGGLTWEMISAYGDYGGVLGVKIGEKDLDEQGEGVKAAWREARKLFPDNVQEKIKSYCWAQYW